MLELELDELELLEEDEELELLGMHQSGTDPFAGLQALPPVDEELDELELEDELVCPEDDEDEVLLTDP